MKTLISKIWDFIKKRNWQEYQQPRSLAISVVIESAELLEHFQRRDDEEKRKYLKDPKNKQNVAEEIADVFIYLLTLCKVLSLDPKKIIFEKLKKNAVKYPALEK